MGKDAKAAVDITGIASDISQSTSKQLSTIAKQHDRALIEKMYDMILHHLKMLKRKYYQVQQAIFASESSVKILDQEVEGILMKKQRNNAAKNPQAVAECN